MSKELVALGMTLPGGNVESFIHLSHQVPMLTQQEEYELATRLREEGDLDAAKRLVMSHLRFVVKIANGYMGYGLPLGDLIQEGNIGLMKAVKRFDPTVGVRLVSFAVHWIKAEIHEFIIRNWRIVKIATTKAQRKLFFNLRSAKKRLGWFTKDEVDHVAETLGVSSKEVLLMESRLNAHDASFDGPDTDDDEAAFAPVHYLEDKSQDPAMCLEATDSETQNRNNLIDALSQLDERSKDILTSRWLQEKKSTLHDLAAKYDISAERVRQLEKNAMNKLKGVIEEH